MKQYVFELIANARVVLAADNEDEAYEIAEEAWEAYFGGDAQKRKNITGECQLLDSFGGESENE